MFEHTKLINSKSNMVKDFEREIQPLVYKNLDQNGQMSEKPGDCEKMLKIEV